MKWLVSLCVLAQALVIIGCGPALAQDAKPRTPATDPLKVSGSVRVRYEAIDGQPRVGFNASDDLLNFRTRVAAEYDAGAFRVVGELYDSRVYLQDSGTPVSTNEVNALEFVQAYIAGDLKEPFGAGTKASLQAGRFTLNLGSRRFIAADDFRNTTNGYTGIKADASFGAGVTATAIYVLPQMRLPFDADGVADNTVEFDRETGDLALWGGLLTVPFALEGAALQPSYYHLDEDDQSDAPTRNRALDTVALRYFREPAKGKIDFDIEAAGQTGSVRTSTAPAAPEQDVWGQYLHAEVGYKWDAPWQPRLGFEYDYVSGDKAGGDYNRFDTLFGFRRGEIAPAGLYNAVGRANLSAPGVRLEVEPDTRWDAFVTYKALYLADDTDAFSTTGVRDASGASGDFAGHQLDARFRYWIVPQRLRFEGTFVYLAKGDFLRDAPNAPDEDDTKYVALDMTYSF